MGSGLGKRLQRWEKEGRPCPVTRSDPIEDILVLDSKEDRSFSFCFISIFVVFSAFAKTLEVSFKGGFKDPDKNGGAFSLLRSPGIDIVEDDPAERRYFVSGK